MIKQQKLLIFCRKVINSACNPLWYHEILLLYIGFHVIPSRACRCVPFRPSVASFFGVFQQFSAENWSKMLFFSHKNGVSHPLFSRQFSRKLMFHTGFFVWSLATGLRATLRPPTGAVIVMFSITDEWFFLSFFCCANDHKVAQKYSQVFTKVFHFFKSIHRSSAGDLMYQLITG